MSEMGDYELTERDIAELAKARERAALGKTIPWAEAKRLIYGEESEDDV